MSIPLEESAAMRSAWRFLLGLSTGKVKLTPVGPVRQEARSIMRHFPLGGDLDAATRSNAPELLKKVEDEADQLAQEVARESARADKAERDQRPDIPPDFLNVP